MDQPASAAPTFFNEPPPVIWTVSLLATVGALWLRAKWEKLYKRDGFSSGGETRFQLTGELLDGKWRVETRKRTPSQRDRQQTGTAQGGTVIGLPARLI